LATIITDIPIDFDLDKTEFHTFDRQKVAELFQKLEFKSLLAKIPDNPKRKQLIESDEELLIQKGYYLIDDEKTFNSFLKELKKQKAFAFDTETTSLDPFTAKLLGIAFSWTAGQGYYLYKPTAEQLKKLKPILEDEQIGKYGHNLKYDIEIMAGVDIKVAGLAFDTMVASYLINPGSRAHNLDKVSFTELGMETTPIEKLIGKKGKNQLSLENINPKQICQYACEDADMTFRLVKKLKPQLEEKSILDLFNKVEMPLIPVLAEMETHGIKVDVKSLAKFGREVDEKIHKLETKIHKLGEGEFNINSPAQLKEVLFNKLKIETNDIKKTKTGLSTAAAELEKMKDAHPIIPLIVEYRELAKLKSTYIESLPELVNKKTGRVHTSFNQAVTATGRLSSSEPNLQNIPIRTELGERIREAFVAEPGYEFLSIDYSQIELRIVASMARDEKMMQAFSKGEDIHTRTAAEVLGIPLEEVTKQQRREAKAVNFGIIYGMGAFGLAQGTGLSRYEAQQFIDKYFKIHKGIKKYLDETKELARGLGYVETLFGRRRYLPDLNANAPMIRNAAERAAINHPIQGTAADLMKMAMIEVSQAIAKEFKIEEIKMLLQVHDSLIFEVKKGKTNQAAKLIKQIMEDVVKLRVPVEAEVETGPSWGKLDKLKL
ncbi:MAG: DNA polymerase I, partial [bacterium]